MSQLLDAPCDVTMYSKSRAEMIYFVASHSRIIRGDLTLTFGVPAQYIWGIWGTSSAVKLALGEAKAVEIGATHWMIFVEGTCI